MSFEYHNILLKEDGSMSVVGANNLGQLGLGHTISPFSQVSNIIIEGIKEIYAGTEHTIFLMKDGSVKGVGRNNDGQLGLGHRNNPVPEISDVPISGVKQVSCGFYHTIFLMEDGAVKAVGRNNYSQLGVSNTTTTVSEISDVPISGVKQISCGAYHTMFLMDDGSVKAVGYNSYGQLGLGHTNHPVTEISDVPISGVKQISCGNYHTMFLMEDGSVKAIGYNGVGQLGLGHTSSSVTDISDVPISGVKQVSCGYYHTLFIMEDGSVKAVGYNSKGQLGLGHTSSSVTDISDVPISNVKQISCGAHHTIFLMKDGSVKSVGHNDYGQLGLGHTNHPVTEISDVPITNVKLLLNMSLDKEAISNKFLFKDGEEIKKWGISQEGIEGFWEKVGDAPATKDMFDAHGMEDLSSIDNEAIQSLVSDTPELLCWTDEKAKTGDLSGYTEDITPAMSQYNSPSPYEVKTSSDWWGDDVTHQTAFQAFDHQEGTHIYHSWLSSNATMPQWIEFNFNEGEKKRAEKYTVMSPYKPNDAQDLQSMAKSWILKGSNDGVNYVDLHSVYDQSGWEYAETRTFTFTNSNEYRIYRLHITENNGNIRYVSTGEIELMEGIYFTETINRKIELTAIPHPQILIPREDISVGEIESIEVEGTDITVIASPDKGITWIGKTSVDITDLSSVKEQGFSVEEINNLTKEECAALFPEGQARFAFYLEQESITDTVEVRSLTINERQYTMSPSIEGIDVLYTLLEAKRPQLCASRDDGETWTMIDEKKLTDLSRQPEGQKLRVKALLEGGQEIQALSYSWI